MIKLLKNIMNSVWINVIFVKELSIQKVLKDIKEFVLQKNQ